MTFQGRTVLELLHLVAMDPRLEGSDNVLQFSFDLDAGLEPRKFFLRRVEG